MTGQQSGAAKQAFAPGHEPAEGLVGVFLRLIEALVAIMPALLVPGLLLGAVMLVLRLRSARSRREAALRRAIRREEALCRHAEEAERQARERMRRGYGAPLRPGLAEQT